MMRPKFFAVSLVYYRRTGEPYLRVDEEGMPIGIVVPQLDIACTTGHAMAFTSSEAITLCRAKQTVDFQGWIEQVTQVHDIEIEGWGAWTREWIKVWLRKAKNRLMCS
jgi:hypothetical protein